ncbi:MAG: DUF2807 domain-containing protein [Bacteroidia bacterium]|nr:DUF2807 domain-containing protein [Bacteroidia bacterium]NNM16363.1 DUF2807 domain-containing protein [Bacteroidia bacterium]
MKNTINQFSFYLLAILFLIPFSGACQNYDKTSIKGEGNVSTKTRSVEVFHSVEVSSGLNLYISQGKTQSVEVKADENFHDKIKTEVKNGVLKIYTKNWLKKASAKDIYVTVTELKALGASGGSNIKSKGELNCESFSGRMSGGSDVTVHINATTTDWAISGAADVNLSGKAESAEFNVSGASDVNASKFLVSNCTANVSGASDVNLHVIENLKANVSGASDVSYSGNPKNVIKKLSGASDLNSK